LTSWIFARALLQTNIRSTQLNEGIIGSFYNLEASNIFEALHDSNSSSTTTPGSSGVQDELSATKTTSLMYRKSIHHLRSFVQDHQGSRLLLKGPSGSGKSLGIASIVEWARASGW
jgi:hypothetical protein